MSKIKEHLTHFSAVQIIVLYYVIAVLVAMTLFSLPISRNPGVEWGFMEALFTAVSAVSVTGLSIVSTADTFSVPGVFILAFVLQFGGIGIMTLGTFLWLLFRRRIGLKERKLIMTDQNRGELSGLVHLAKEILLLIVVIELIGALILSIHFLKYFPTWQEAFIQGFFASVSATTNAGFDITGSSLEPFAKDYFVQLVNMILLILGAIGFPVLIELKAFLAKKPQQFQFSLYTKLTTVTFGILILIGAIGIYLFERKHFFVDKSWHESLFYSLFQSVTTRNGGLATMNIADFDTATQLFISVLMFIGASPSSVGGGIRTTTFAIIILAILAFARGKSSIKIFGREIDDQDMIKSFIVITVAMMITGTSVILLAYIEPFSITAIIFEVCSAFGTTGLSMGITADLSTSGKLIIIFLMFVGRIGIFAFLFIIRGTNTEDHYHYPKEKIIIG